MKENDIKLKAQRREFLGTLAAGAATIGLSALAPLRTAALPLENADKLSGGPDPDEWFKNIKGKHRMVFDVPHPNEILPFAWPRVFLKTNLATGSSEKDCSVAVVLRHSAIPYAMDNSVWQKYNLGEVFKVKDPATGNPATRNPFWQPKKGDYKVPGIGELAIGINELQESGVKFFVCDTAITVNSAGLAAKINMDAAAIRKDWEAALLPGIQLVPSGVWAIGRAQENGCGYCFAG